MSVREKPNAIWIFGDQHRSEALGCNGDPNARTPNLDIMSVNGLNFPNAVGGFPLCCPFRGSLLTSRYPHECVAGHQLPMDPGHKTIAHAFKENGYETAYLGKWHLDGFVERGRQPGMDEREGRAVFHTVPRGRRGGFDYWLGFENNNSQWDTWLHGHRLDGEEVARYRLPGYETDCLSDLLIDYIQTKGEEKSKGNETPFFAVLSAQPPHNPYVAPPEFMANYNPGRIELRSNVPEVAWVAETARRDLAGMYAQIENLDMNVGRIREALSESGLADDTHLIFFSDHGDMHGSHGQFKKTSPYHESLGIPFIITGRRDQYLYKNGRPNAPVNHVDIAPTTLGLCGIDKPEWMRGTDYSHLRLRGREPLSETPDSAYIQSVVPTGHGHSVDRSWRGVVTRDGWKWVVIEGQPFMLFNRSDDPYERVNMAFNTAFDAKRKELNQRLARWIADTGDSFQLPDV